MDNLIDLGDTKFWQYNACVGTNGINTDWSYYNGFVEATKHLCLTVLKEDECLADFLIYPIVFCTRHSLELAIKTIFRMLFGINNHLDENSIKLKNHDIPSLFNKLISYSKFDDEIYKNLVEIRNSIPEIIRLIIKIDISGETFRYRKDTQNKNHLDGQLALINIKMLYDDYSRLVKEIDDYINLLEYKAEQNSYLDDYS